MTSQPRLSLLLALFALVCVFSLTMTSLTENIDNLIQALPNKTPEQAQELFREAFVGQTGTVDFNDVGMASQRRLHTALRATGWNVPNFGGRGRTYASILNGLVTEVSPRVTFNPRNFPDHREAADATNQQRSDHLHSLEALLNLEGPPDEGGPSDTRHEDFDLLMPIPTFEDLESPLQPNPVPVSSAQAATTPIFSRPSTFTTAAPSYTNSIPTQPARALAAFDPPTSSQTGRSRFPLLDPYAHVGTAPSFIESQLQGIAGDTAGDVAMPRSSRSIAPQPRLSYPPSGNGLGGSESRPRLLQLRVSADERLASTLYQTITNGRATLSEAIEDLAKVNSKIQTSVQLNDIRALARAADLLVDQLGVRAVHQLDAMETLLRRLYACLFARITGNWKKIAQIDEANQSTLGIPAVMAKRLRQVRTLEDFMSDSDSDDHHPRRQRRRRRNSRRQRQDKTDDREGPPGNPQ